MVHCTILKCLLAKSTLYYWYKVDFVNMMDIVDMVDNIIMAENVNMVDHW